MANERVFEIGMALAGGSTRGAYSAGVMDFMLQALHEWEKKRAVSESPATSAPSTESPAEPTPPWYVCLKTLAGTSAGGITASIATASLGTRVTPLPNDYKLNDPAPAGNNLFKVWVQDITLERLFATTDLDPAAGREDPKKAIPVRSLLCSDFMPWQASVALQASATDAPIPRFADNLELYVTTSNLRGVPYSVENFQGASKELTDFRMTRHRDWVGFSTTGRGKARGLYALDLNSCRDTWAWEKVRSVAQGTATLPLVFPIKSISCPRELYESRSDYGAPSWPASMPEEFVYDAVDGGVFRNEPMELVRSAMEANDSDILSHDVKLAKGSMILLHPSPKRDAYEAEYQPSNKNMLSILWSLLGALMEEANFQDRELSEMTSVEDISRFLIAPVRAGRLEGEDVLATDTFHGFGGIIDEEVRLHDFQLGRRNCQRFLQKHFAVPFRLARENKMFGEESGAFAFEDGDGELVVPIIPLYGSALEECPLPRWPRFPIARYNEIRKRIHRVMAHRAATVFESFAVSLGFFKKGFLKLPWNFVVERLVKIATRRVMTMADETTKAAMDQFK